MFGFELQGVLFILFTRAAENHVSADVECLDVDQTAACHPHRARIVHTLLDRAAGARRLQVRRERRGRAKGFQASAAGVLETVVDLGTQVGAKAEFGGEGFAVS